MKDPHPRGARVPGGGHVRLRQRVRRGGEAWAACPCPSWLAALPASCRWLPASCPASCCANTWPSPGSGCISNALASSVGGSVTAPWRRPCSMAATAVPTADPRMLPTFRALAPSPTQGMPRMRHIAARSDAPLGPFVCAPFTMARTAPVMAPGWIRSISATSAGRDASEATGPARTSARSASALCRSFPPLSRADPFTLRALLALLALLSAFRTS